MTSELTLKYVPLSKLTYWEQNPKLHDIGAIAASITKHGFRDPLGWDCQLNGGEGGVSEGNGRRETLARMKEQKSPVPRGILEADGDWLVPVLFGVDAESEAAAQAFAIDHNSLTMMGGAFTALDISKLYDTTYLDLLEDLMAKDSEALASFSGDDWDFLKGLEENDIPNFNETESSDQSGQITEKFQVLINCVTETQQTALLDRLTDEGYECRSLIS